MSDGSPLGWAMASTVLQWAGPAQVILVTALGSGTALGETYSALQRMALSWKERGIILCVSSKNDEAIALDAFRNHPEMVLKEDDIVAFRVNWDDKAVNIRAIADTIDLGLDAFVFLDDNPAEHKRVRDALPAVAVPELPEDPTDWLSVFQAAGYFEQAGFSKEDQLRAGFYKANRFLQDQSEERSDYPDLVTMEQSDEMFAACYWRRRRCVCQRSLGAIDQPHRHLQVHPGLS